MDPTVYREDDLLKIIAIRKDTFCVLAVHDVDGVTLTPAQESSLALALRTRAQTYPESEYYGTGVMRAMRCSGRFSRPCRGAPWRLRCSTSSRATSPP